MNKQIRLRNSYLQRIKNVTNFVRGFMSWSAESSENYYPFLPLLSSFTSSLKQEGDWSVTPGLCLKYINLEWERDLVKMSAVWSMDGAYLMSSSLFITLSLIKWTSNSICLDLAWKIGF